jgi:hypothetical protein
VRFVLHTPRLKEKAALEIRLRSRPDLLPVSSSVLEVFQIIRIGDL